MKTSAVRTYSTPRGALSALGSGAQAILFNGDCLDLIAKMPDGTVDLTVTSPPYCMGMEYERATTVDEFIRAHKTLLPEIIRITKPGGSICWQVGYHISEQAAYPLDYAIFSILDGEKTIRLRNRIIWSFAHGLHSASRFSGRHETVLWFTKGSSYFFDLDSVRIPQKYPGKRHYKGPSKGQFSGNPLGKNPGDVWDIPNVKGNHIEKSGHPCQFPVALVQRLVRALCPKDALVFDPFMGAGSSGVAAAIEERRFLGAELKKRYFKIGRSRIEAAHNGEEKYRPIERPIYEPAPHSRLVTVPSHFKIAAE